jgi:hypothetical protein
MNGKQIAMATNRIPIMQRTTDFTHPSTDEINRIMQEAHRLRSEAFHNMLSKMARAVKGAVYPKGTRAPASSAKAA